MRIKNNSYWTIIKPGIIFGNLITLSGGFFFGAKGVVHFELYFAALIGMALIIAAGCVFNNVIDRDIDAIMRRNQQRPLVVGAITVSAAMAYASILAMLGILMLLFTNSLTACIAVFGLFCYVVLYSLYAKRHSVYSTEIGAIAGAIPPVVGYCAATHVFDLGALALFLILLCWQLPHSYAIAINHLADYRAANIAVMPLTKGLRATKWYMLILTFVFVLLTLLPTLLGLAGYVYFCLELLLGGYWLFVASHGLRTQEDQQWAKTMFSTSLLMIIGFSILIALAGSIHSSKFIF